MKGHAIDRFVRHVTITDDDHWLWDDSGLTGGYPRFLSATMFPDEPYAHRWLYRYLVGEIPDGHVLASCPASRLCVNPDHLTLITLRENLRRVRMAAVGTRTHCTQGHPLTPDNVYVNREHPSWRACVTCARERARENYHRRKGQQRAS